MQRLVHPGQHLCCGLSGGQVGDIQLVKADVRQRIVGAEILIVLPGAVQPVLVGDTTPLGRVVANLFQQLLPQWGQRLIIGMPPH